MEKELINYRLYVTRAQYNVLVSCVPEGREGSYCLSLTSMVESVRGLRGSGLPCCNSNLFKTQSTYKAFLPPTENLRCSPIVTIAHQF